MTRIIMVGAVVALLIQAGCIPLIGAGADYQLRPSATDQPWAELRTEGYRWVRKYDDWNADTVEITTEFFVPLGVLKTLYEEAGGEVGSGQIVMGLSEMWTWKFPAGRKPHNCHVRMHHNPQFDPETWEHELRHCRGWVHQ